MYDYQARMNLWGIVFFLVWSAILIVFSYGFWKDTDEFVGKYREVRQDKHRWKIGFLFRTTWTRGTDLKFELWTIRVGFIFFYGVIIYVLALVLTGKIPVAL